MNKEWLPTDHFGEHQLGDWTTMYAEDVLLSAQNLKIPIAYSESYSKVASLQDQYLVECSPQGYSCEQWIHISLSLPWLQPNGFLSNLEVYKIFSLLYRPRPKIWVKCLGTFVVIFLCSTWLPPSAIEQKFLTLKILLLQNINTIACDISH